MITQDDVVPSLCLFDLGTNSNMLSTLLTLLRQWKNLSTTTLTLERTRKITPHRGTKEGWWRPPWVFRYVTIFRKDLTRNEFCVYFFRRRRQHAIPLFVRANILPVDMLCYKSMSILMHDIHCKSAPSNLLDLFTRADSFHSCNTRSASAGKFYIKHSSHSFSRNGCKIWNGLPEHLRTQNKTSFKKCLQQTLLQLLEHEDNYADVHTLIKKIPSFRSIATN